MPLLALAVSLDATGTYCAAARVLGPLIQSRRRANAKKFQSPTTTIAASVLGDLLKGWMFGKVFGLAGPEEMATPDPRHHTA